MAEILFVTWDGGGNVPPTTEIAGELQRRGHTVRFLGHAVQEHALTGAGFEFVRPVHARAFSALDANSPFAMMATFGDRGLGRDLLATVDARPVDLVVIDCLMVGALHAAHGAGLRYVVLEHLYDGFYRRGILGGPMGISLRLRRLRPQAALGAAAMRLVTTTPALDTISAPPPNLRQVGPVVDHGPRVDAGPSVLISLSTYAFAKMQRSLQALVDAASELDARVVVTTGPAIDPETVSAPPHVEVHRFVPHVELMPSATLFVGHGGHGSTMQALAHDLPMVLMPMDPLTDQPTVARSVATAGAARVVAKKATAAELAPVLAEMLADGPHRAAAARLGAEVRRLPGAILGADALEELVRDGAARPGHPSARP
jgi:UDP:flavonoid glycosyltransferase YjiC (YdhE family)